MRSLVLSLLAVSVLCAQVAVPVGGPQPGGAPASAPREWKPEELCTLEGKVTSNATGEALGDVTLTLRPVEPPLIALTTTTDASGSYAMKGLEPGTYVLTASRRAFANMSYGARGPNQPGTRIQLVPGQKLANIDIHMIAQGVLTGRVVDQDGEPMTGVVVSAQAPRYIDGRKQFIGSGAAVTDDRGQYRIYSLAPGRYVVNATVRAQYLAAEVQDSSQQGEGYLPAYFPGVPDPRAASAVEAMPGQVTPGVNFQLKLTKVARIRGRVASQLPPTAQISSVRLSSFDYGINNLNSLPLGPSRQFEFRNVAPGPYSLQAQAFNEGQVYIASLRVEVAGADIDNLILTVARGVDLPGEVRVADSADTFDPAQLRISVRPIDSVITAVTPRPAIPDADGKFTLSNVGEGKYLVFIAPLPAAFYVKSMRLGEQDVLEEGLDLSRGGGGSLQVVLSGKAAKLAGAVVGSDDKPLSTATVALVPQETNRQGLPYFYKNTATNQYGQFTFTGIQPGSYKVFAWERVDFGAWTDPDFLAAIAAKGKSITIRESGNDTVDLKAIPGDAQ